MKHVYILFCLQIIFGGGVNAQPGTLDESFGTGDKATVSFGKKATPEIKKAVLQLDDKIIEAGNYYSSTDPYEFLAVRFTADGVLDSSYGSEGKVVIQFPFLDQAYFSDVSIQKDNKILLSGYGYYNYFDPVYSGVITRINTDGSIDSSFGTNGVVQISQNNSGSYGAIAIQADNKIVAVGSANRLSFITRFLENGTIDLTFGENGYVYISKYFAAFVCKIQPDGKIVVGGDDYQFTYRKFRLERYMPDGTIDKSFGNGGTVITPYEDDAWIHDLAFQQDGKIVVTGETTIFFGNFPTYFATARYNQDGSLDSTFGVNGKVTTSFESGFAIANSIVVQKDDKIILGGEQGDAENDYTMQRLTANGTPDSTFGENSIVINNFGYFSYISSVLLQTTGKIIAAGSSGENNLYNCSAARYNNDDLTKKQIIISRIRRWLQHHNGIMWDNVNGAKNYAVQRSGDGIKWSTLRSQQSIVNNHLSTVNYYNDPAPLPGTNYYRLSVTSTDGATAYSNIIAVTDETSTIKISPNPAKNILRVEGLSSNAKLTIVDFTGNIKLQAVAKNTSYNFNIASLTTGNYLLKIEMNGEVVTKKFVKE